MTDLSQHPAPLAALRPDAAVAAADVRLERVTKRFGEVIAVDDLTLEVGRGEFFALLGPSGSGKTTCLRMIAGFEQPTSGTVHLAGRDVTTAAPFAREVNTVFQDYALFPHMTVEQNVAYGLMVRKVPKAQRRERAAEPLGALDRKLREEMQVELKLLQREVGITFVFVTHDQDEALTMADRIAVFKDGRVEQVGSPEDIYDRPETAFVADFIGTSNAAEGAAAVALFGAEGQFAVRPERLTVHADGSVPAGSSAAGEVLDVVFAGAVVRRVVTLDAGPTWVVTTPATGTAPTGARRGDRVIVTWQQDAVRRVG